MDKIILKKFAIESRQDLMQKIKNKINTFYVEEKFSKEQKGDLYLLSNEKHTLSLTNEEYKKRELLIKRIKELSLEQVIEEAAYTWFNRIVAIRYMEINDMLPLTKDNQSLGIRVLSSRDNTPDPEILKFTNLTNPDLDIEFKREKYVELKDDNEKFKYVLLLVCKKLGRVIPQVFDGITDYIDILIPDNLLNDTGFITKIVNEVPQDNYNAVEIIGWLYQYYNQTEKDRVMSAKKVYKKNEIPYATQLFTPNWIVKYMVENSVGRYWLENNGLENDVFSNDWKYFVTNYEKNNCKITPSEIKIFDPCCGSGHILVYAFELLYQIYLKCGYNKQIISELILENNLYGLDIDERAVQLSILSIILKTREYDKNIFNKNVIKNINIFSIVESNNINLNIIENLNTEESKKNAKYLLDNFRDAKEIGSLLKLNVNDYSLLQEEINDNNTIFGIELKEKIIPMIKISDILTKKFEVVVTNPPYMNSNAMSNNLKSYLQKNYTDSKTDLCTAFMEIGCVKDNCYLGIINQQGWMFLSSFENLRKKIVNTKTIVNMIHLGTRAFEEIGGEVVQTTTFIMKNGISEESTRFIRLVDYNNAVLKEKEFLNIKNSDFISNVFDINIKELSKIPAYTFAYWISPVFYEIFNNTKKISDFGEPKKGLSTGDNNKFLRFWYEIDKKKIGLGLSKYDSRYKWIPLNKGGEFRKWYGNNDYVVNWENNGKTLKEFSGSVIRNESYYFKKSITWTMLSSTSFGVRASENGKIFEGAGPSLFVNDNYYNYILGLMLSKLGKYFINMLNPTMNINIADISNIPVIINSIQKDRIDELVKNNINLSKDDWDSFETSWDFKKHPLLEFIDSMPGLHNSNVKVPPTHLKIVKNNYGEDCFIADEIPMKSKIYDSFRRWEEYTEKQFNKLKENEQKINEIFIDIYGLKDELTPEVEDKDITIRKADKEREIKSLISYAVGCMFGRYSLDKEGLIYAGGDFYEIYKKCKKTDGGWAGVSLSNYKVLNDNGQEIDLSFEVDNDNVIPITDEAYFSDDIVERFKTFISVVYGEKTLNENLDFIAETIGKKGTETSEDTIRRYFVNDFFNDHVKTYQKRPIYWLFDSGKKNGFKALVYMHRYNENLIPKVRLDYLHRMQTTYEKLLTDVNDKLTSELSMTDKKEAQKRQADLNAKLQEIREYDEKIAHIANQRISIDLDDGVKVNYDKFKDILAKIK